MSEYLFTHGGYIECPECPGQGKRNKKPFLICSETNYSGCSIDIGHCEECGKCFRVSFQVKDLTRTPEWDGPDRKERVENDIRDAEARALLCREKAESMIRQAEKEEKLVHELSKMQ